MNYKIVFTIMQLMLLIAVNGYGQKSHQFTVQQTVDYAMQNATQVKNALIDVKIQQQTNKEITSAAYPQLNGSAGVNYFPNVAVQTLPDFISLSTYGVLEKEGVKDGSGNTIAVPAPDKMGFIQAQFGTKYTSSAGLELSQLLFDGQVFVGLQARRASIELANLQVDVTKELIKANVQKIYYQLVVGKQQMGSISDNIDRLNKLLRDTKIIYENGFAEKLDVDKVNVQLSNLLTERLRVQNTLDAGNAGLKYLINMPQKDELILVDTVSEEMLQENVLVTEVNYADRKEFQLLNTTSELLSYNIKRHKYSYLPTLAAFGSYSKNAQRNQFNIFGKGPWFTTSVVGLSLSVPIFDGFARQSRIEKARLELEKNKNSVINLQANIDNEVEQAKLTMTSSLVMVSQQKQNMELAEKVYNATKLKYEQGLGSNQEIYNAQTELKMAQTNYYSAMYDAIIAKVDFLKAIGKL